MILCKKSELAVSLRIAYLTCEPLKITYLVYFDLHSSDTQSSTTWEGNSDGSMVPSDFFPASTQSINIFFRVSFISKAKLFSHTCQKDLKKLWYIANYFLKTFWEYIWIWFSHLHIIGQKNFIPKWHSFSFYWFHGNYVFKFFIKAHTMNAY